MATSGITATPKELYAFFLLLAWKILQNGSLHNAQWATVLGSLEKLLDLGRSVDYNIAAGLLDYLLRDHPPDITFLKSLDSFCPNHVWGVYLLVLEHPHKKPLIYVGQSTSLRGGIKTRLGSHYAADIVSAKFVKGALKDGYAISHSAPLWYCRIPHRKHHAWLRVLITVLEATFSCFLWSMPRADRHYGFRNCSPFRRRQFSYGGCCSHSPLLETYRYKGVDLTDEQHSTLEGFAEDIATLKRVADKARYYQNIQDPTWKGLRNARSRASYHRRREDPTRKATFAAKKHKYYTENREQCLESSRNANLKRKERDAQWYRDTIDANNTRNKKRRRSNPEVRARESEVTRRRQEEIRDSGIFACHDCALPGFRSRHAMLAHYETPSHQKQMYPDDPREYPYYCYNCYWGFDNETDFKKHNRTYVHKRIRDYNWPEKYRN